MSRLADSLVRQIAGSPASSLHGLLGELRARFGSVTAAARAAGIDRRTWQRYESGAIRSPKAATLDRLNQTARQARIRDGVDVSRLHVDFRYAGRTRRLTDANLNLAPGTGQAMTSAYLAGDHEGVAQAFIDGIDDGDPDGWYHGQFTDAYENDLADSAPEAGEGSDSVAAFP